jgi:GT2 family glycosyltransferase
MANRKAFVERATRLPTLSALPLVSIVVLSYNRPVLLAASLESVLAQSYPNVEVLVIDNRSAGSAEVAEVVRRQPRATLIANSENLGFTGGMNQGFGLARGKYVHFTEDDIVMDPECVQHLVNHLEANEDVALASGVMLYPDGVVCCAGGMVEFDAIFRVRILRENQRFDPSERLAPYDVSFVPGSFMCARKSSLMEIGPFNADFYLYFEDTELCARVLKAGYKIRVVPDARVEHATRPSGVYADYVMFHRLKNGLAIYFIHAPVRVLPEFLLRNALSATAREPTSNQRRLKQHLAAWSWVALHLPDLVRERRRVQLMTRSRRA